MWYFNSPRIVYGDDALNHLEELEGQRAFIVTDETVLRLGLVERVKELLAAAGLNVAVFSQVESDPSLQTARRCASALSNFQPDWVIGLGGGSCIDAAKAAWFMYERPHTDPAGINPMESFGLRAKARLVAIPTTSGTGAEVTLATTLTDTEAQRKLGLGSYELIPDIAIVDPSLVMGLPAAITADTGLDVLSHAVEGYTSRCRNDFSDGLCLKAIQMVFSYLPRAYADGSDANAREHMHNAATIAGLGFGNSMAALAHAMGHALGAVLHISHGRAVSLYLPYTIEFVANAGDSRYADIAYALHLPAKDEVEGASSVVHRIRKLMATLNQPMCMQDLAITLDTFEGVLPQLIANAESDTQLVMSARIPDSKELEQLFRYAFEGKSIDF